MRLLRLVAAGLLLRLVTISDAYSFRMDGLVIYAAPRLLSKADNRVSAPIITADWPLR